MNTNEKIKGLRKLIEEKRKENDNYSRILSQYESYRIRFLDDIEYLMYPAHSIFSSDSESDSYTEEDSDLSSDGNYYVPAPKKAKKVLPPDQTIFSLPEKNISPKKKSNSPTSQYKTPQPSNIPPQPNNIPPPPNNIPPQQPNNITTPLQSQLHPQFQQQGPVQMFQLNNLLKKLFPAKSSPTLGKNNQSITNPNPNQIQFQVQPQSTNQIQNEIQAQNAKLPLNSKQSQATNKPQITTQPQNPVQANLALQRTKSAPIPNNSSTIITDAIKINPNKHYLFPKIHLTPQPILYPGIIPGQAIPNKSQNIYEFNTNDSTQNNIQESKDTFSVSDYKVVSLISQYREKLQLLQEQQFINILHQLSFKSNITAEIVERVYKVILQKVNEWKSLDILEKLETADLDETTSLYLQTIIKNKHESGCNQINLNSIQSKLSIWSKICDKKSDQFIVGFQESVKPYETLTIIDNIDTEALKNEKCLPSNFIVTDESFCADYDNFKNE